MIYQTRYFNSFSYGHTGTGSGKPTTPPLKNGSDLRESGYLIAVGSRTARYLLCYQLLLSLYISYHLFAPP